jgi:hypothetical protein
MKNVMKKTASLAVIGLVAFSALSEGRVAAQQAPYVNNYGIPMNGPYDGASQWFRLQIRVSADGTVSVLQHLTNDVSLLGWCGVYHLQLFELGPAGPGTGPLLLDATSAGECVGPKGGGHENTADYPTWELHLSQDSARRFMARPDIRAVSVQYQSTSIFDGWDQIIPFIKFIL